MFERVKRALVRSEKSSRDRLIHFDSKNGELILGLHSDTYMNDPTLSPYVRRILAQSGPFLTSADRECIAMGFRDVLNHIVVNLAFDEISGGLLEFLIRAAFARHFQDEAADPEITRRGSQSDTEDLAAKALAGDAKTAPIFSRPGEQVAMPTISATTVAKLSGQKWRRKASNSKFTLLLFDEKTFARGMTAQEFQSELLRLETLGREELEEMISDFLVAKEDWDMEMRNLKQGTQSE